MKNRVKKNSKNAQRRFCIRIICVYKEGNLCAEMRKRRLLPQRCGAQLRPKDAGLFTPGGRDYPRTECAGNVSTPLSFSYEKESAVDGRKKEWQRGDFDFPPLQSPLKRPRRGLRPPSWIFPKSLICAKHISSHSKTRCSCVSVSPAW